MSKKAEAYDYLLEIAISDLMNRFAKRGLDSSLCVFIEAGEKHNSIAFQDLLKLCKHGIFGKIKHLELVGKKGNFSLQVADMIAYEGFRVATNETGPIKRPERKSFTVIKAGNPLNYYLHHSVSAKYWLENIHNGVYGEDKATGANK